MEHPRSNREAATHHSQYCHMQVAEDWRGHESPMWTTVLAQSHDATQPELEKRNQKRYTLFGRSKATDKNYSFLNMEFRRGKTVDGQKWGKMQHGVRAYN